jgi:hypothetical protein
MKNAVRSESNIAIVSDRARCRPITEHYNRNYAGEEKKIFKLK